jgi:hypothetical protein
MNSFISRISTAGFGTFYVSFCRMFSRTLGVSYKVFIKFRDMTVSLVFEVAYYSFFRKIADVYFDFSLIDQPLRDNAIYGF